MHRIGNELVVVDPANRRVNLALNRNLDFETVTMHLAALVTLRQTWKGVRGLESEIFGESCFHRLPGD
jgi:hypothetical protein